MTIDEVMQSAISHDIIPDFLCTPCDRMIGTARICDQCQTPVSDREVLNSLTLVITLTEGLDDRTDRKIEAFREDIEPWFAETIMNKGF